MDILGNFFNGVYCYVAMVISSWCLTYFPRLENTVYTFVTVTLHIRDF